MEKSLKKCVEKNSEAIEVLLTLCVTVLAFGLPYMIIALT